MNMADTVPALPAHMLAEREGAWCLDMSKGSHGLTQVVSILSQWVRNEGGNGLRL